LLGYHCQNDLEEQQAIREITQEVVLAALGRSDFFKYVLFQGGTCLRIFYGLNRFSEDMDFILRKPNAGFRLDGYLRHIANELLAYGYHIEISDRSKAGTIVKKAFIKDTSLGKVINLQYAGQANLLSKISIKIEVDSNPPLGSGEELQYIDFPFVSSAAIQDKPSLFAGKIHALLCREYIKGRDWYDFIWYTSNCVDINYEFLGSAINQLGPWQDQDIMVNKKWVLAELEKKIIGMDWQRTAQDVRRFLRANEQPSLDLWSRELFLHQLEKII
jgi:predicted nucleotidyltransferase component of viral defense system